MNTIILFNKFFMLCLISSFQADIAKFEYHDYYVSTTQVDYYPEKKLIQLTIRMFVDDFEKIIKKNDNKLKIHPDSNLEEINQYIIEYVNDKFKISVNKELVVFDFIGKEYKTDLIQVYFEIKLKESIETITFENKLLFDFFVDQQNIIHFKKDSFRKSFLMRINSSKANLLME